MVEHGYVTNTANLNNNNNSTDNNNHHHDHHHGNTMTTTALAMTQNGDLCRGDGHDGPSSSRFRYHKLPPPPSSSHQDHQHHHPPQDVMSVTRSVGTTTEDRKALFTMGATTAMAIALHNFPEGLVTFVAYLDDPAVGVALAIGIAMHNIPEGLCVSMPILYATGKPWKAFCWGAFSGCSEPLGALLGYFILKTDVSGNTYGTLFGFVAGMMIFISIDELLPMAFKLDPKGSIITIASVLGMLLVACSVLLFKLSAKL